MTPLLETAGWALIHFVWQGCAIAAAVPAPFVNRRPVVHNEPCPTSADCDISKPRRLTRIARAASSSCSTPFR